MSKKYLFYKSISVTLFVLNFEAAFQSQSFLTEVSNEIFTIFYKRNFPYWYHRHVVIIALPEKKRGEPIPIDAWHSNKTWASLHSFTDMHAVKYSSFSSVFLLVRFGLLKRRVNGALRLPAY